MTDSKFNNIVLTLFISLLLAMSAWIANTVSNNQLMLIKQQVVIAQVQKDLMLFRTQLSTIRTEYVYEFDKRLTRLEDKLK
ncbi:hypothetical protein PE36_00120 [Moritella sp. PE36]|uniref:hypothetical protein n=1 Tax=Moritella sp. PE36 TaxID=58051 RepID=UPI0001569279|nr:hypothetical protein [Moritella sp. PE36]EDM66155.1 hypothetical protein PE36_00120 [Moritella sp. PE36]